MLNKNISIWRGTQTPPTNYHLWEKEDGGLYVYLDEKWQHLITPADKIILDKGLYSLDGICLIDDSGSLVLDENDNFIERPKDIKDLYLIMYNNDFEGCLTDYFTLTGYPNLIPRYALGAIWYKNDNYSTEDVVNLVNKFNILKQREFIYFNSKFV